MITISPISELRTQNSEIVYLTLNLQIHATHKLNNYIIPIGAWETSVNTKRILASTVPTHLLVYMEKKRTFVGLCATFWSISLSVCLHFTQYMPMSPHGIGYKQT